MSSIKCYSSVSVVDGLDVGQLQAYLTSNHPNTVVYDPNSETYTPNWSEDFLYITPVIYYDGNALSLTANGLTIKYSYRDGSGAIKGLPLQLKDESGHILTDESNHILADTETVTDGVLKVTTNKLESCLSGIVTYICDITYIDPKAEVPIHTQITMTYSLVTQATEIKYAYVTGENAFLYNSDRNIVGANTITLTADVKNVSITAWQYLNSSGQYVNLSTSGNLSTLTVAANNTSIWVDGRVATIKLTTSDPNVYDIHQIIKIYDGAAGNATVSVVLTNQSHYLPCNDQGTVLSWVGADTSVLIYEGGVDVTTQWTVTPTLSTGLSGIFSATVSEQGQPTRYNVFVPSALSTDTGYVDFQCVNIQDPTSILNVRYTLTKTRSGADGQDAVIYELSPDALAMNLNVATDAYSPQSITFYAYTKTGEALAKTAYAGRIVIQESTDGTNFSITAHDVNQNEASVQYSPSATSVVAARARLYAAGGKTTLLDEQTVVITRDGERGDDGEHGLTMGIANFQDVIPCGTDGKTLSVMNITIPFYAYDGITRIPITSVTTSSLPSGITITNPTTAPSDGHLLLRVSAESTLGNASTLTGTITITLTSAKGSCGYIYTWTKGITGQDGQDGTNANILQIYSENGGIIHNSYGSTTLKVRYISGSSTVTPTEIKWYKFTNGAYRELSGQISESLVVQASDVTDFAFYRCVATYNNVSCEAFYTVDDLTDPITTQTLATVAEFKNGQGCGAIYTRLYRKDGEVDPLKCTVFSTTAPSSPQSGDYWYQLNSTNKTCILKKYDGSSWENATEGYTYTYKYYRINKNGQALDTSSPYKTQRCVYVDPSIIGETMQFICEVE